MRRVLILFAVAFAFLVTPAHAESKQITIGSDAKPSPNPTAVSIGDTVFWHNDDSNAHKVLLEQGVLDVPPAGDSTEVEVNGDISYRIDTETNGPFTIHAVPPSTTTTASTTTTTTKSTTTSSSSTTTSTSTTTTSSSTTTTTLFSSGSVGIDQPDNGGGGSSALPLIVGGVLVVGGLAAGAYYLWQRSGGPYDDDGPDWTQEPPTMQGPTI